MNKKHRNRAHKIMKLLRPEYPNAGTRLHFTSTFELLVAAILSAQSTDEQVNRVTVGIFPHYNRPEHFAVLTVSEIENLIKGCGLYRNKAKSIKMASEVILERFNGQVPDTMEDLMQLPGVGRKTANVVLNVGFGKPGLGVDTHVQRVAYRLGLTDSQNPEKTELQLKALFAPEQWGEVHHLLIGHGRAYCKAINPRCQDCPIRTLCVSRGRGC